MDVTQVVDGVMAALQGAHAQAVSIGAGVASNALWDWVKSKFKDRSAGAAEAVEAVLAQEPKPEDWGLLKAQFMRALAQDPAVLKEVQALLGPAAQSPVVQTATTIGNGNTVVQNTGNGSVRIESGPARWG